MDTAWAVVASTVRDVLDAASAGTSTNSPPPRSCPNTTIATAATAVAL